MRLIDADALKYRREEYDGHDDVPMEERRKGILYLLKEDIDDAPTIDAMPVVRCKDCRWKEQEQIGMVYCPATVGGWVDEKWFCKGGERSEK